MSTTERKKVRCEKVRYLIPKSGLVGYCIGELRASVC